MTLDLRIGPDSGRAESVAQTDGQEVEPAEVTSAGKGPFRPHLALCTGQRRYRDCVSPEASPCSAGDGADSALTGRRTSTTSPPAALG